MRAEGFGTCDRAATGSALGATLTELPAELLAQVTDCLEGKDLATARRVCRTLAAAGAARAGAREAPRLQRALAHARTPGTALALLSGAVARRVLPYVERISLGRCALTPAHMADICAAFAASPPQRVRSLHLNYNNDLGPAGAAIVAACPHLPALRDLSLVRTDLGNDGLATLAASPHLARLRRLFVGHNGIGDDGARELAARSKNMALARVDLVGNYLTRAGVEALTRSRGLPHLLEINLTHHATEHECLAARRPGATSWALPANF